MLPTVRSARSWMGTSGSCLSRLTASGIRNRSSRWKPTRDTRRSRGKNFEEDVMQVNTYLNFNGQCEEAFRFYEKVFGGKIDAMIPHEGTPAAEHVPAAWLKKIMHAHLVAGNVVLMGSDVPPERYSQPKGFAVALHTKQVSEGERI